MGEHEPEWALVMPFVVCDDNGGPYESHAFVAGRYLGCIESILGLGGEFEGHVPTPLVPQLDLLAMHHGRVCEAQQWVEAPDEWTWVRFVDPATDDEPPPSHGDERP